jgi:flagellar hook capping protein FlgD
MIKATTRLFTIPMTMALMLFLSGTALAQTFAVSANSASATGIPDSYIEPYVQVENLSPSVIFIDIAVVEDALPDGWDCSICLVNCFAPGVLDVQDQLDPNAKFPFKLTITTGPKPASGYIIFSLTDHFAPFNTQQIRFDVSSSSVSVTDVTAPRQLSLAQNYPNPVSLGGSSVTNISYAVPYTSQVTLKIFNLLGKEVKTLVHEQRSQGMYTTLWDGRDKHGSMVPPGVYVYKISNGKLNQTRRMLITR